MQNGDAGIKVAKKVSLCLEGRGRGSSPRHVLAALTTLSILLGAMAFTTTSARAATPETPKVEPPSQVKATSAILRGLLNPGRTGEPGTFEMGTYEFVYRQSATSCKGTGEVKTPEGLSLGAGEELVVNEIESLTPGTQYTVCLVAHNEPKTATATSAPLTFTTAIPPEVPENEEAEPAGYTATLKGTLNPHHPGEPGTYEFLYRKSEAGECEGESATPPAAATGGTPEPVSAEVTGLLPNTKYAFCLLAENQAEEVTIGSPQTFETTDAPPAITDESVLTVASNEATVVAQIATGDLPSTYYVEYGARTPEAGLTASKTAVSVEQKLTGLVPGTEYHYRFVAHNGLGTVDGEEHSFTTHSTSSGSTLIDDRQWEMVSPPDKDGAQVEALNEGAVQAAETGDALAYQTTGPLTGAEGNTEPFVLPALAVRGSDGWTSQDINTGDGVTTGASVGEGREYRLFSSDLSLALVEQLAYVEEPPLLAPDASERTEYLRADAPIEPGAGEAADYAAARSNGEVSAKNGESPGKPGYLPLLTPVDTRPGVQFGTPCPPAVSRVSCASRYSDNNFESATPDLSHIVLRSRAGLTPQQGATPAAEARGGEGSLYEWSASTLALVSVLPDGKQAGPPYPGTEQEEREGSYVDLGAPADDGPTDVRHAISNDGSRVVWTETAPLSGSHTTETSLYMRDMQRGETVRLDKAATEVTEPAGSEAVFQTASPDGSRIFFTDSEPLTKNAGARPESAFVSPRYFDLYVCEVYEATNGMRACALQDLTPRTAGESARVQGEFPEGQAGVVLGASEEGCDIGATGGCEVYFVAKGRLSGANGEGHEPVAGKDNLYVDRYDDGTWTTAFIATLSDADAPDWTGQEGGLAQVTSRVSPSGRYLAFMSEESLTGYDNEDITSKAPGERRDEEVFEYDAHTERLVCASCNPSGERPAGVYDVGGGDLLVDRQGVWRGRWLAANVPPWTEVTKVRSLYQPRYLSDEGRLFFDSPDALVRQDSNGKEDVYEYEPLGGGGDVGCRNTNETADTIFSTEADGCVGLISSGGSSEESAFLDASVSGDDVFFITTAQLSPPDSDHSYDVYDAHVCSGETAPCFQEATATAPACNSRASCSGTPSPQPPAFGTPASVTFSGTGDVPPAVVPSPVAVPKTAAQIKAEKLAKALKLCKKDKNKKKREKCEASAKKQYGAPKKPAAPKKRKK